MEIFVPGSGELLGVGRAERAERLLAALEDSRRAHRGELGSALDQPRRDEDVGPFLGRLGDQQG